VVAAVQRRKNKLMKIQSAASNHHDHVRLVRSERISQFSHNQAVLARKISFKMDLAADRKYRILNKRVENLSSTRDLKLQRGRQTKELVNSLKMSLRETIEAKMRDAVLQRCFKLEGICARLVQINQVKISKRDLVKVIEKEKYKYLDEMLHCKYLSALTRRNNYFVNKLNMIRSKNRLMEDKVQASNHGKLQEKMLVAALCERRLQAAMEKRELLMRSKTLRCVSFSKVDQVRITREAKGATAKRELLIKLSNKMDVYEARRNFLDQEKHNRSTLFNQRREQVLFNLNSKVEDSSTALRMNAARRCQGAERRRMIMLMNRTITLAQKRMKKVLKGAEIRQSHIQRSNDTYDRFITKQVAAFERKQEKLDATMLKNRPLNINDLNSSNMESVKSKLRYDIEIALNDAAERREALLMIRAEQAGFMGSRRTKSDFSPAFLASCELSYSLSMSSDSSTTWEKPPQCCIDWESTKGFDHKMKPIHAHFPLWILGFIQQLFVSASKKIFVFGRAK
jgi:hypothetical protein